MHTNNQTTSGSGTDEMDIIKIVLEVFKDEFPGAPESEVNELMQDIGQTIMIESMAKMVDEVEARDKTTDKVLAKEVKELLSQDGAMGVEVVKRISEVCSLPHINIDLEQIYKEVAVDVVKDVLGK
jgi:hypothetical protein